MNKTIHDIVDSVKKKKNLKSKILRVFRLTHTYDELPREYWVSAPYTLDVFETICAFIQFESDDIEESFSMDQTDIIEILEKMYDCKEIGKPISGHYYNVDLYVTREMFCGYGIQKIDILKRDGMDKYLNKYIESFYHSKPEWRPDNENNK